MVNAMRGVARRRIDERCILNAELELSVRILRMIESTVRVVQYSWSESWYLYPSDGSSLVAVTGWTSYHTMQPNESVSLPDRTVWMLELTDFGTNVFSMWSSRIFSGHVVQIEFPCLLFLSRNDHFHIKVHPSSWLAIQPCKGWQSILRHLFCQMIMLRCLFVQLAREICWLVKKWLNLNEVALFSNSKLWLLRCRFDHL